MQNSNHEHLRELRILFYFYFKMQEKVGMRATTLVVWQKANLAWWWMEFWLLNNMLMTRTGKGLLQFQDIPNMQMMNFGMMMLTWNNWLKLDWVFSSKSSMHIGYSLHYNSYWIFTDLCSSDRSFASFSLSLPMLPSLLPLSSFSLLLHFSTNTLEILPLLSGELAWFTEFIHKTPPSYSLSLGVILLFSVV